MASNYDGLTRNAWPGTYSPSADHPIVLDTEIRGSLRTVTGQEGDKLTDITGQRLEIGMLAYLSEGYNDSGIEFLGDRYYQYNILPGQSRNPNTGSLPNSKDNWQLFKLPVELDDIEITSDIIPSENLTYDIGSEDKRWKGLYAETLYLGTNTIFLGTDKITLDEQGRLLINDQIAINPYSFNITADDSSSFTIEDGQTISFVGGKGITTRSDSSTGILIEGFSGEYQDLEGKPDIIQEVTTLLTTGFVGDIIPAEDAQYDLGSPEKTWRDLWMSGSTIRMGGQTISATTDQDGLKLITFDNSNGIKIDGQIIKVINNVMYLPPTITIDGDPISTFSGDYNDLINTPEIAQDISELTDRQGLLTSGFSFKVSADDSTEKVISNNETIKFSGSNGVTTASDEEGNITISGPDLAPVAETGSYDDLTDLPSIPSSLDDLVDVDTKSSPPSIGQVLKYNGTKWTPGPGSSGDPGTGVGGDASTLNGFDGTYYLNYNNLNNKPEPYQLPPATTETLGGVRIGENINVNNGTISVPKGAGINKVVDIPDVYDDDGLPDGAILAYNSGAVRWETQAIDLSNSVMDGGFY